MQIAGFADTKYVDLFEWSEQYNIGYADIDSQHKRLFQLADQLYTALAANKGKPSLSIILNNLIVYTKRHFADEEVLMELHRCPGSSPHRAEHRAFTEKLEQFQKAYSADRTPVTRQLLEMLLNSMVQHMAGADQKMAAHLQQAR
jgi:hemerythrin-like metal-binding protein